MDALIHPGGIGRPLALALATAEKLYGSSFNPEITLKALSYFDDGNLRDPPAEMKVRLAAAVQEVDLDHLPTTDGAHRGFAGIFPGPLAGTTLETIE